MARQNPNLANALQNAASLQDEVTGTKQLSEAEKKQLRQEMGDMDLTNASYAQRIKNFTYNRMADYNRLVNATMSRHAGLHRHREFHQQAS